MNNKFKNFLCILHTSMISVIAFFVYHYKSQPASRLQEFAHIMQM